MADAIAALIAEPQPKQAPSLSATSDMPEVKATPALSEATKTADQAAKAEADAASAKAAEDAKTKGDGEPAPDDDAAKAKELSDGKWPADTPPWVKGEVTKERNRRREADRLRVAAETHATQLQGNLTKALSSLESLSEREAVRVSKETEKQDPRPKRESFDNPEAYDTALIDWSARRASQIAATEAQAKIEGERKAATDKAAREETERKNKETADVFVERKTKFMKDHPDYEDVAEAADVNISIPMSHAILSSEDGPAIAYYLGQNPDEATRISKLDPINAVYEIGRIAARITAKPAVSTKPAPINPLKTGAAAATRKTPDEESMEEYGARRSAELAKSKRPFLGSGAPN